MRVKDKGKGDCAILPDSTDEQQKKKLCKGKGTWKFGRENIGGGGVWETIILKRTETSLIKKKK